MVDAQHKPVLKLIPAMLAVAALRPAVVDTADNNSSYY